MAVFLFYLAVISGGFALCAALADGLGRLFPGWMEEGE